MTKWEYMAPYIFGDLQSLMIGLGKLGEEGWELVQLENRCSDGGQRVFLKRVQRLDLPIRMPDGFYSDLAA